MARSYWIEGRDLVVSDRVEHMALQAMAWGRSNQDREGKDSAVAPLCGQFLFRRRGNR